MMIIIGTFIRGPGWMWFWPGMTWDESRLVYAVNRDLPDLFNITNVWAKAIFGAVVVGAYYVVGGLLLHSFFKRTHPRDYKHMSFLQYNLMMFFFLTMIALPVKILARLVFNIKYVMVTPWFNI